jgi:hypothetical protein
MSEMRSGDSDHAAHGAKDIRSGPDPRVRDSGSPADCAAGRLAHLARKIPGKASVLVGLAETCDFKPGGREGLLGAA